MRLTKVVLDTNVVVSAHLKAGGLEAFVLDLALASKLQLYSHPTFWQSTRKSCADLASESTQRKLRSLFGLLRSEQRTLRPLSLFRFRQILTTIDSWNARKLRMLTTWSPGIGGIFRLRIETRWWSMLGS